MGGRSINVIKAFNLLLNEAEAAAAGATSNLLKFGIGRHDNVPAVVADHPQVKMHCGTDEQLSGVVAAPTAPAGDMVPLADLEAARADAANLRAQVDELTASLSVQGSVIEGLQAQVRQAGEARAQSEADLAEATDRIREMAVRLNIPAETVLPAGQAAPAGEAPAATPAAASGEAPATAPAPAAAPPAQTDGNPDSQNAGNPDGQGSGDPVPAITVQHKGAGRYAVFRGEEQVSEPGTREEAEAKAAEIAAQAPGAAPAEPAQTPPAA